MSPQSLNNANDDSGSDTDSTTEETCYESLKKRGDECYNSIMRSVSYRNRIDFSKAIQSESTMKKLEHRSRMEEWEKTIIRRIKKGKKLLESKVSEGTECYGDFFRTEGEKSVIQEDIEGWFKDIGSPEELSQSYLKELKSILQSPGSEESLTDFLSVLPLKSPGSGSEVDNEEQDRIHASAESIKQHLHFHFNPIVKEGYRLYNTCEKILTSFEKQQRTEQEKRRHSRSSAMAITPNQSGPSGGDKAE